MDVHNKDVSEKLCLNKPDASGREQSGGTVAGTEAFSAASSLKVHPSLSSSGPRAAQIVLLQRVTFDTGAWSRSVVFLPKHPQHHKQQQQKFRLADGPGYLRRRLAGVAESQGRGNARHEKHAAASATRLLSFHKRGKAKTRWVTSGDTRATLRTKLSCLKKSLQLNHELVKPQVCYCLDGQKAREWGGVVEQNRLMETTELKFKL